MSIAKMSTVHNSYRYITVAVDRYKDRCMKGIIYHGGRAPGIQFENFLEMVIQMDSILNRMSCPKRTVELRQFSGTAYPSPAVKRYDSLRAGRLATFRIYVRFRYNASWQGELTWLDGERKESFESLLQMMCMMDQILTGQSREDEKGRPEKFCQIAVDTFSDGLIEGSVQNAYVNHFEKFKGAVSLAEAMVHLIEIGVRQDGMDCYLDERKIISEKTWDAYRKGGKKATFLIHVLYKEHGTWQGVICWRENGERLTFRSFMEMLFLMASAVESERTKDYHNYSYLNVNEKKALMEG